jgi:c-di-GMP-binding flagellar brake protein YcgR
MTPPDGAERRKFARLDLALTVSYVVSNPTGPNVDPREALSTDISAGGLRLMTPTALEMGATLDLNIFLAEDEDNPIKATGEVVWQNKLSNTSYETGVVIREMPEEDKKRFMSFVFDQMAKVVTG